MLCERTDACWHAAKQSFADRRSQAGAWERDGQSPWPENSVGDFSEIAGWTSAIVLRPKLRLGRNFPEALLRRLPNRSACGDRPSSGGERTRRGIVQGLWAVGNEVWLAGEAELRGYAVPSGAWDRVERGIERRACPPWPLVLFSPDSQGRASANRGCESTPSHVTRLGA